MLIFISFFFFLNFFIKLLLFKIVYKDLLIYKIIKSLCIYIIKKILTHINVEKYEHIVSEKYLYIRHHNHNTIHNQILPQYEAFDYFFKNVFLITYMFY
jgi:hypothetical protein